MHAPPAPTFLSETTETPPQYTLAGRQTRERAPHPHPSPQPHGAKEGWEGGKKEAAAAGTQTTQNGAQGQGCLTWPDGAFLSSRACLLRGANHTRGRPVTREKNRPDTTLSRAPKKKERKLTHLDVVVEAEVLVAVALEQLACVLRAKILKLRTRLGGENKAPAHGVTMRYASKIVGAIRRTRREAVLTPGQSTPYQRW